MKLSWESGFGDFGYHKRSKRCYGWGCLTAFILNNFGRTLDWLRTIFVNCVRKVRQRWFTCFMIVGGQEKFGVVCFCVNIITASFVVMFRHGYVVTYASAYIMTWMFRVGSVCLQLRFGLYGLEGIKFFLSEVDQSLGLVVGEVKRLADSIKNISQYIVLLALLIGLVRCVGRNSSTDGLNLTLMAALKVIMDLLVLVVLFVIVMDIGSLGMEVFWESTLILL